MKLAILIPAYNEEQTIGEVIEKIPKNLPGISDRKIIVVDDGSMDKTAEIALAGGAIVVSHRKNLGVGRAFQSGLEKALELKVEILVTIDADNQFDSEEIVKLIKPIIEGLADFVTGSRFIDLTYTPKNMPKLKKIGNIWFSKLMSWATGQKFHDVSCGFRAYGCEAMLNLNLFGKFTYTQETFLNMAFKRLNIMEVPVTVRYFAERKSKVASSLVSYGVRALNIIFLTIKDFKPLKFFGISGLLIFFLGLVLDIFVIAHYVKFGTFSPYKMVGFLAAFLNAVGIMIVFIGILADLIDKIRLTQEKLLYYEKKKRYEKA